MSRRERVLVVDDEADMAESCAFFLDRAGFDARTATSGEMALALLEQEPFALVVTDVKMPRMSGMQLLLAIKARDPDIEVLLITGYPDIQAAVASIKQGAFDYLTKPYVEKDLMDRVERAVAHRRVKAQNAGLRERLRSGPSGRKLIHASPAFRDTLAVLERAARTDASVLIQGESGTGKELLAHHLHDVSARADKPFVPVDCAAIPAELFESELFGHVRGAFTGAIGGKLGLFALADKGTLFLDELGELPLPFQSKLLRAIQERQIRPVGGTEQVAVDVRIVAATNRNLQVEVEAGRFRQDLFYRLDVVRIAVPPLRDRREDIDVLAMWFLQRFGGPTGVKEFGPDVLATLRGHEWPGNVRQLRNVVERACALATGPMIGMQDLPAELIGQEPLLTFDDGEVPGGTFQQMKARKIAALESAYLEGLLKKHGGNVTHCAEEAGMTRSAFQKLMQKYGIKSSDFRD
ncbi:MAG: sigma-54-dependent Fis family transcriptional regulator [Planctomycetes bacterium]|nr:sigma-54-dependent Fis family transcriptional regulator [Planctomycetota bacterium]